MRLGRVNVFRMNNADYCSFMTNVKNLVVQCDWLKNEERCLLFCNAVDSLISALDSHSDIRLSLANVDLRCDRAWMALCLQCEAMTYHHDDARVAAALSIFEILEPFGNPTAKPYSDEYDAIDKALSLLENVPIETQILARVDDLIPELRRTYNAFRDAEANDSQRIVMRDNAVVRDARTGLQEYWSNFVSWLNVVATDDPSYDDFIAKLNVLIDEANTVFRSSKLHRIKFLFNELAC